MKRSFFLGQLCGLAKMDLVFVHAAFIASFIKISSVGTDEPFTVLDKPSYRLKIIRPLNFSYNDKAHDVVMLLVDQLECHDIKSGSGYTFRSFTCCFLNDTEQVTVIKSE
jgi:hypothetical protein